MRALVCGGGGVTGIAWEFGILHGLASSGVVLSDADVLVGTSAGSVVATQIATGVSLEASYARQVEGYGTEIAARFSFGLMLRFALAVMRSRSPQDFGARAGRIALAARTVPEAQRRAVIASRLPVHEWPDRTLRITAIDALSGELRVFERDSGAPLVDAVAASCAVPGIWPAVTIQGRRYIDGGTCATANVQLAAGCERVVVLAPILSGALASGSVATQVAELERAGARVTVVSPDAESVRAIGRNVLDPARRAPAARAGLAQSAREIDRVRAAWSA